MQARLNLPIRRLRTAGTQRAARPEARIGKVCSVWLVAALRDGGLA